jgi:hypothetical protein
VLEGGYHLEGLRDSIKWVLDVMIDEGAARRAVDPMEAPSAEGRAAIDRAKRIQSEFWKNL